MDPSIIEELRLDSFKSFRNATLDLREFTLLAGRNGSGKSNALDGLWTLCRLAGGDDIREALDGGRDGPSVRGGAAGCAPFGEREFALGCTVRTGSEQVRLDVRVAVEPDIQVVSEQLKVGDTVLLTSDPPAPESNDLVAAWNNNKKGQNPKLTFRSSRLLTSQVLTRVPEGTKGGRRVHRAAGQVLAALRALFVLDPVPHQMRRYVPRRDSQLRRNAENLSAALALLLETRDVQDRIREDLQELNEQNVVGVSVSSSELGDVMVTCIERLGGRDYPVPARLLSDGSLRYLAILTALLQAPERGADIVGAGSSEVASGQTTLVIEELENGLHASQTSRLVSAMREEVGRRKIRALTTAHSPAALDALAPADHAGVVICQRSEDGRSELHRLVELPSYVEIVAHGGLGRAAVHDGLRARRMRQPSVGSMLDEILGGTA